MGRPYYQSLDGLRGVAVTIVLLAHAGVPGLRSGGVGVDIFFTLSGFLITSILLTEQNRLGSISIKNFYLRRILRLVPCLWMVVFCFLPYSLFIRIPRDPNASEEAALALMYVMNWVRAYGYEMGGAGEGVLAHTWSLAIEEQYYLIWPFIIIVLGRTGLKPSQNAILLGIAAITVALYRASVVGVFSAARIYFGLDTHADGLIAGSALAYFVSSLQRNGISTNWSKLIGFVGAPCAVFALGSAIFYWTWEDPEMAYFGYAIVAAASTMITFDLVMGSHSVLRRLLSIQPTVWIGKISYGLYLWHFPIYDAVHQFDFFQGYKRTLLVAGTLTFLVAGASYYLVEKRFLLLKDRFTQSNGYA